MYTHNIISSIVNIYDYYNNNTVIRINLTLLVEYN